jgi:hypothetical protein
MFRPEASRIVRTKRGLPRSALVGGRLRTIFYKSDLGTWEHYVLTADGRWVLGSPGGFWSLFIGYVLQRKRLFPKRRAPLRPFPRSSPDRIKPQPPPVTRRAYGVFSVPPYPPTVSNSAKIRVCLAKLQGKVQVFRGATKHGVVEGETYAVNTISPRHSRSCLASDKDHWFANHRSELRGGDGPPPGNFGD